MKASTDDESSYRPTSFNTTGEMSLAETDPLNETLDQHALIHDDEEEETGSISGSQKGRKKRPRKKPSKKDNNKEEEACCSGGCLLF